MGRIVTGYLAADTFFGTTTVLHLTSAGVSEEQHRSAKKVPASRKAEGLTAYEVAVLLAIGAAILSCL